MGTKFSKISDLHYFRNPLKFIPINNCSPKVMTLITAAVGPCTNLKALDGQV